MNLLFMSDIYENANFTKYLIIAIIILALIFAIVFLLGLRDLRKSNEPEKVSDEDMKDFSFDIPENVEQIKEDVTFEMPSLTKNLQDFKKSIEEEMQKENKEVAIKTEIKDKSLEENSKPYKILDIDEIEDTSIIPKISNNDKNPRK